RVVPGQEHALAVRGERRRRHRPLVSRERANVATRGHVPQLHRVTAKGQGLAVGRKGQRVNTAGAVPTDLPDFLAGRGVPEADRPVRVAGGGEQLAVGAVSEDKTARAVGREAPLLAGRRAPQPDGTVVATRHEGPAVGGEREGQEGDVLLDGDLAAL